MPGAAVLILHREASPGAGPLEQWLAKSRGALADHQRQAFLNAGAATASVVAGPPDDTPFGTRLRRLVEAERPAGLVVLGSGSIPLATDADRRAFVSVAAAGRPLAMTNNRFSSDVVAVGQAELLGDVPELVSDNALPRWLAEVCRIEVRERRSARLGFDIDAPLDLVLLGRRRHLGATIPPAPSGVDLGPVRLALARARSTAADPRAELLVSGRTSAASLAWLERSVAARVRALVEERGLRSAAVAVLAGTPSGFGVNRRLPRSILGALLERDGPAAIASIVASLADAAILDTRVLLAHRLGADERGWPRAEDRFASDLLLPEAIEDSWLRELTTAARDSAVPIVLGGHTLVGPGLRLALGGMQR